MESLLTGKTRAWTEACVPRRPEHITYLGVCTEQQCTRGRALRGSVLGVGY